MANRQHLTEQHLTTQHPADRRPADQDATTLAEVHRILADFTGAGSAVPCRAAILARLSAACRDPDLLSVVAATHATAACWHAPIVVDLLIEAGAEQDLIQRHLDG